MIIVYTQRVEDVILMATCLGGIYFRGQTVKYADYEFNKEDIKKELVHLGFCKTTIDQEEVNFVWGENLLTLCPPDDYSKSELKYADSGCFLPKELKFKPAPGKDTHANFVKGAFLNKGAKIIYNASIGSSGNKQFASLYTYSGTKKNVLRVKIDSMTPDEIYDAFKRPIDYDDSVKELMAEITRQHIFYVANYNLEQVLTTALSVKPVRVSEIPVLNYIVNRSIEIKSHEKEGTYALYVQAKTKDGVEFTMNSPKARFRTEADAYEVKRLLPDTSLVTNVKQEEITELAEGPHNTESLIKAVQSAYGYMPAKTTSILNSLFQLGLVTDVDTTSRLFPNISAEEAFAKLQVLKKYSAYTGHIAEIKEPVLDESYFSIDRESGIMPTGKVPDRVLTEEQKNVYEIIGKEVLKCFYPPRKVKKTTVTTEIGNLKFNKSSSTLLEAGFTKLDKKRPLNDVLPENISLGDGLQLTYSVQKKVSSPIPYYQEADIITYFLKKTPFFNGKVDELRATIELMIEKGYLVRKDKKILETEEGRKIIQFLSETEDLADGSSLSLWNSNLEEIMSADSSKTANNLCESLQTNVIQKVKRWHEELSAAYGRETDISCPSCGNQIYANRNNFLCHTCAWKTPNTVKGRFISDKEMKYLLTKRTTPLISGFATEQGPVVGRLYLDSANQVKFTRDSSHSCPSCGAKLWMDGTQTQYTCPTCDFTLKTKYLHHTLSREEIEALLKNRKTPKIDGLESKGQTFNGFLYIDADDKFKVKCIVIK